MSYNATGRSAQLDTPLRLQAWLCTPLNTHGSPSESLDIDTCDDQLLNISGDGMFVSASVTPAPNTLTSDAQESQARRLIHPDGSSPTAAGTKQLTGAEFASGACFVQHIRVQIQQAMYATCKTIHLS